MVISGPSASCTTIVSRPQDIKKLESQTKGGGQYRLRIGRFRFRSDLFGQEVWLFYCGLRSEEPTGDESRLVRRAERPS